MNSDSIQTPKIKKKKKPIKKIPRVSKKPDVKSSTVASLELESEQIEENNKLWVLKDDGTVDWEVPTYVFFAKDETIASEFAKEIGISDPEFEIIERRGAYMLSMGERQSESDDVEMSEKGQEEEEEMRFWISSDHTPLYPYTPGSVIVAKNEIDAKRLLEKKLQNLGLQEIDKFSMNELQEEKGYQISGGGMPSVV